MQPQTVSRSSFNLKLVLMIAIAVTSFAQGDVDVMNLLSTQGEVILRAVNVGLLAWLYLIDPTATQVIPGTKGTEVSVNNIVSGISNAAAVARDITAKLRESKGK